jgi:hypothetical protein
MSNFMSGGESHIFAASPCASLCESEFSKKLTRELGRELVV